MTCGIYKIKNDVNGKLYIGQSVDIEERWKQHKNSKRLGHLYSAFKKHGLDNFTFSIICECPESALDEYEISYIKYYNTTDRTKGYNLMSGGSNGRHSDETKKKLSETNKGKSLSDETKKKMSSAQKGKLKTAETKNKISESNKGHKHNLGKTHSSETKNKISESNKGHKHNLGKTHSSETKNKLSAALKKQYLYQGILYNGKRELADFLRVSYDVLTNRISRKTIDVTIIPKSQSAENRPS